jgi:release factor glutamine methyltransferase
MLTIGAAFYQLRTSLQARYDESEATAIAHIVLETVSGLSRLQRLSEKDTTLNEVQDRRFSEIESQLRGGRPLQYVLGEAPFLGRMFRVDESVLIPRPETEELVEWILADGKADTVLDIGTGSGCIAVSLKLGLGAASVTALDFSEAALAVARANAEALAAGVHFQQQDFLDDTRWTDLPQYDVIVSNPPYIPLAERAGLEAHVRDHEPGSALFVPDEEPLLFYKAIAQFGQTHLKPGGAIYCELHRDHAAATADMFSGAGYREVTLREDLHAAPRMLRAKV